MNESNYFNSDGAGGGFSTARGAKTPTDFARQRSKNITALIRMNTDIVGLIETENDGTGSTSALQNRVNGLNQAVGVNAYAFVDDGGATQQPNNTDLIHCASIYKPTAVVLLGPALMQFINKTMIPAGVTKGISAGDYNANYEEDPLDVLWADGLCRPHRP